MLAAGHANSLPNAGPERACRRSDVAAPTPEAVTADGPPYGPPGRLGKRVNFKGDRMLWLIIGVVLLIIAIAGGTIVHPLLFVLAILALLAFFAGRRGRTAL
jgi:hypothetical protein